MTSSIFEDLQSPVSYDADFDRGWRQILEKGEDPVTYLYELLRRVYWEAVQDEMANAILAFDDYKTFVPKGLPELDEGELESEYLRELIDLWDPLELPEEIKNSVCQSVYDNVKGFTDYDYVQEYRRPTFPSLGAAPQVDQRFPGIYEAIQCSECRACIRSFHFYECKKGCSDYPVHRSSIKTVPEKSMENLGHIYFDCLGLVPYRLCCNCIETSAHLRDHLKVTYRFKRAGDKDHYTFSQELDALEDHNRGQSLMSFGNAFLDHITAGGLRRSMNARRLFPAGNSHCALIHPGGALISTRSLPTLGRHSPRDVLEYLRPEDYRTIQGCDVFCSQLYSVSPKRQVYEATKKARERRFLCSRKQLSGGLFTDYNSNPQWKAGEALVIDQFLRAAEVWRTKKSRVSCFNDVVNPSLYLLASKLGKTQKLAYSRMSNNCQDFCNGLLDYDSYYHPMFRTIYPFIPVSLSLDVEREPDERCLSYLQSFVKPLQYPIPGFRSQRAMIGSAVTMYSSYAQNDADLIDHVYSVRFGRDRENGYSLGFSFSKPLGGDPYLLKDEEMSCSDRFAAAHMPGSSGGKRCTLADHVLDCPVDNLSILQTHLHRNVKYYIDENGEFLTDLGPTAWITNRLQILRRLNLLNDFMAEIASHFQELCRLVLPNVGTLNVKTLQNIWRPGDTIFSRAFHMDKRDGNKLYYAPDIDFGEGEMDNWRAVRFLTFGTTFTQTHRQVMGGDELFMTRLKTMKSLIVSRLAGKEETWSPWKMCTCNECKINTLSFMCRRLDCNAIDNDEALQRGETPVIKLGHPDYVSSRELLRLVNNREYWKDALQSHRPSYDYQEEYAANSGREWISTHLLCLRIIYGAENANPELLRWRLEEYGRLERGEQDTE
ncbi:hypothetical protein BJX65DRAFT_308516 [Aspergillus insuetus]